VAAGLVLVLGVLAGADKLRDVIWRDQPPVELGDAVQSGPAEPVGSLEPGSQRITPDAGLAQYAAGASTSGPTPAAETTPAQVIAAQPPAGMPGASSAASRKPPQMVPFLQSLSRQATESDAETAPTQAGAGPQVTAYLMDDAGSAGSRTRLCDGGEAGRHPCTETEKSFMKDTVVSLPSGVKYKVIRNGSGRSPQPGDTVVVSYRGVLPDGTEFDSSGPGGTSETFRLSQAIPGLQDVLQYMEAGAKWEVYLPTELAFPKPGRLGAQEVIFVIELLAVLNPQAPHPGAGAADVAQAVAAQGLGAAESYWQSGTGGQVGAADAVQTPAPEAVATPRPRQRMGAAAEAYLQDIARQDDVVSLPSGLLYRVLKTGKGNGLSPTGSDTVVLKYRTTLPDGREVGRSDKAAAFKVDELNPAWQEALQHMQQGAQWELYTLPELASRGGTRKRGMLGLQPLIYQLELVSINPAGDTPAGP
jgi:FKBP-type peptidyl-prolyl cis-trans isomerase